MSNSKKPLFKEILSLYKYLFSPLFSRQCCRYLPTCSHYCSIAITTHGVFKGGWLTLRRLCRCNPWFGSGGVDLVPLK